MLPDPILVWQKLAKSRGYLLIASDAELENFLRFMCKGGLDKDLAFRALVELTMRCRLAYRSQLPVATNLLVHIFPRTIVEQVLDWLTADEQARVSCRLSTHLSLREEADRSMSDVFQQVQHRWKSADGLVPLVIRNGVENTATTAVLLPFIIERSQSGSQSLVECEQDASQLEAFQPAWHSAIEAARQCGLLALNGSLKCIFTDLSMIEATRLEGRSAVAPFFIGIALHQLSLDLPATQWFASGDINSKSLNAKSFSASDPEWQAKFLLAEQMQVDEACRFLPPSWPGVSPSEWKPLLVDRFSSMTTQIPLSSIAQQLESLTLAIHNATNDYSNLKVDLRNLLSRFSQVDDLTPRQHRLKKQTIQLLADVACHQGEPTECIRLLESISQNSSFESCLQYVRYATAYLDRGQLNEAEKFTETCLTFAEGLNEEDRARVKRDAYGTRGQVRIAKALISGAEEDKKAAKADLKKAIFYTDLIEQDLLPHQSSDKSRNLCYLLQWYAFFKPQSHKLIYLYKELVKLTEGCESSQAFVWRAAHLVAYRSVVAAGDFSFPTSLEDIPVPDTSLHEGWPAATTLKYRGAIQAAQGHLDLAEDSFLQASCILEKADQPTLQLIQGSILLQAAESLEKLSPAQAQMYLKRAEKCFSQPLLLQAVAEESPLSASHWKHYILTKSEGETKTANSKKPLSPQIIFVY